MPLASGLQKVLEHKDACEVCDMEMPYTLACRAAMLALTSVLNFLCTDDGVFSMQQHAEMHSVNV